MKVVQIGIEHADVVEGKFNCRFFIFSARGGNRTLKLDIRFIEVTNF